MTNSTEHRTKAHDSGASTAPPFSFSSLMLMFRSAWADWMTVPTGSMNPTIIEGDRILVDKHVFGLRLPWTLVRLTDGRDPQRGEIVVFDSPADGISLVKRLVGVPGDVIAHRRTRPDDQWRIRRLLAGRCSRSSQSAGRRARSTRSTARRACCRRTTCCACHSQSAEYFGPVRVPEGMYLMLGDNRDNSADSRYIGFVPRRNIVGLTSRVAVSFDPDELLSTAPRPLVQTARMSTRAE